MMAPWITLDESSAASVLSGAGELILRTTAIFLFGWIVARSWRTASAAQRHLVWVMTCAFVLLLPLLQRILPEWGIPLFSEDLPQVGRVVDLATLSTLFNASAIAPAQDAPHTIAWNTTAVIALLAVWMVGVVTVMLSLARSHRRVRRLVTESVACDTPHVLTTARAAARAVSVNESIPVRYHATAMPFVCGLYAPTIVLPIAAAAWSHERLFDVLTHELAHVARRDMLTQLIASATCALYWFNPLAWNAARALRTEREVACDDRVLNTGSRPSRYATHLLELSHVFQVPPEASIAALAFARPSQIQNRLRAIVDPVRHRGHVRFRHVTVALMLAIGIGYPIVTVTAASPTSTPTSIVTSTPSIHEELSMNKHVAAALGATLLGVVAPAAAPAQDTVEVERILTLNMDSIETRVPDLIIVDSEMMQDTVKLSPKQKKSRIQLRGSVKTVDPIVIIDGVRVRAQGINKTKSALDQINPNDIQSIEVFKGPSAATRYGKDAENGVIVITTKAKASVEADTL